MAIWHSDTSALAKLIRPEPETRALRSWLVRKRWIVSDLHRTELHRAAWCAGGPALARAERVLAECEVVRIDADTFDRAGTPEPSTLHTLDALHLAAALTLGADLSGIVVYDERLRRAAADLGLRIVSPGSPGA